MEEFKRRQLSEKIVLAAFEASIYEAPLDAGLKVDEVFTICKQAGLHDGECRDALRELLNARKVDQAFGDPRIRLLEDGAPPLGLHDFTFQWDPDPREPEAFQFVYGHLAELERELGRGTPLIGRSELVARGRAAGQSEKAVQVAIEAYLLAGIVVQEGGVLRRGKQWASPRDQQAMRQGIRVERRIELARVLPFVRDVVSRRTDGRPSSPEPLEAFSAVVEHLGHGRFLTWWAHLRQELATTAAYQPTMAIVLCAALAEGAFALIGDRGQAQKLMELPEKRKEWTFDVLLKAARSGRPPILGDNEGQRWRNLNLARHRIHAGRLLDDTNIPVEWKPEEVRASKETLDLLLRRILEWPLLASLYVNKP